MRTEVHFVVRDLSIQYDAYNEIFESAEAMISYRNDKRYSGPRDVNNSLLNTVDLEDGQRRSNLLEILEDFRAENLPPAEKVYIHGQKTSASHLGHFPIIEIANFISRAIPMISRNAMITLVVSEGALGGQDNQSILNPNLSLAGLLFSKLQQINEFTKSLAVRGYTTPIVIYTRELKRMIERDVIGSPAYGQRLVYDRKDRNNKWFRPSQLAGSVLEFRPTEYQLPVKRSLPPWFYDPYTRELLPLGRLTG